MNFNTIPTLYSELIGLHEGYRAHHVLSIGSKVLSHSTGRIHSKRADALREMVQEIDHAKASGYRVNIKFELD